jgi:hypothetical protein
MAWIVEVGLDWQTLDVNKLCKKFKFHMEQNLLLKTLGSGDNVVSGKSLSYGKV